MSSKASRAAGVLLALALGAGCASAPKDDPDGGEPAAGGDAPSGGGNGGNGGNGGSIGEELDAGPPPELGAVIEPGDPGTADVRFEVRADREMHAISPLVYGTNGAPMIARTRQALVRSGGNRLTAYNWENNASNAGKDYMFQNDGYLSNSDEPGRVAREIVETGASNGAATVVTVPIVDYVSADKDGGGDVRNSGSDYLQTRFRQNRPTKGAEFSETPDVGDEFVYQDEFVAWLKQAAPQGAEVLFSLDNEPELWASTHAEVHPERVTYEELWDRNLRYASAIKAVWPEAEVLGFVSYGFNGYINLQNAPDAEGRDFIEWYLAQAKAEHDASGQRVIDYLDLHWYPEARGGGQRITAQGTSEALVEARLQAPRSLWDATYSEDSWVRDNLGRPIDLLHWIKGKLDSYYPGTRLAITEWNYGGGGDISGALAVADVLGIFGREEVGLAAYWPLSGNERFAWAGFRVYRNYDGSGARFGNTSVFADSSDDEAASVYASIDSQAPERSVIVAINKRNAVTRAALTIAHPQAYARAAVWVLAGTNEELTPADALEAKADNAFVYEMPPRSVSVIVPEP